MEYRLLCWNVTTQGFLPIWNRQQQNTRNLPRNAVGYVNQPRQIRGESYRGKQNAESIFAG